MKKGTIVENAVTGINRRDFLKGAVFSALGMTSVGALAGCSPAIAALDQPEGSCPCPPADPDRLLTLDEVNALRKELIDSKGEYVRADGTVIPAAYVKVRALIDSMCHGSGSEVNDESFGEVMYLFTEEEAQAYLEMPRGVVFTAADFAYESGRDEAECLAICEDLASRSLLHRNRRAGVPYFHLLAESKGFAEYTWWRTHDLGFMGTFSSSKGKDFNENLVNSGVAYYYALPVNKAVVADEEIMPYDDWEAIIRRNPIVSVTDCVCRTVKKAAGSLDPACTHPTQNCLATGEEAEFVIENGLAHQVTQKEALEILRQSVEAGLVIQSRYHKEGAVICCCHSDCCFNLGAFRALGEEAWAATNVKDKVSHYNLQWNKDLCIKCGACKTRCTMATVSMGEDGYPATGSLCVSCGQCGITCPVEARKLTRKETIPELPHSLIDEYNLTSEYRFRKGKIY